MIDEIQEPIDRGDYPLLDDDYDGEREFAEKLANRGVDTDA